VAHFGSPWPRHVTAPLASAYSNESASKAGRRPPVRASALTAARTMQPSPNRGHPHPEMIFNQQPEMQLCPETPADGVPRHHRELAGTQTPTTCFQGPGETSRNVPPRLRSGITRRERRLKSGYVAVTVAVSQAMIIKAVRRQLPTSWISNRRLQPAFSSIWDWADCDDPDRISANCRPIQKSLLPWRTGKRVTWFPYDGARVGDGCCVYGLSVGLRGS